MASFISQAGICLHFLQPRGHTPSNPALFNIPKCFHTSAVATRTTGLPQTADVACLIFRDNFPSTCQHISQLIWGGLARAQINVRKSKAL